MDNGISENGIIKLFSDDIRYTTDGTAKEKGTGLGLLLCKEIVEKQGGNIVVESENNKESNFYFAISLSS